MIWVLLKSLISFLIQIKYFLAFPGGEGQVRDQGDIETGQQGQAARRLFSPISPGPFEGHTQCPVATQGHVRYLSLSLYFLT